MANAIKKNKKSTKLTAGLTDELYTVIALKSNEPVKEFTQINPTVINMILIWD
ncbi:hypothetical protein D3C84_723740 [compost metagenome]